MKQNVNETVECIETTIGELIEMLTQIAVETGSSEQESYELASITLQKILSDHWKEAHC